MTSGIGRRRAAAQKDTSNTAYIERRREIVDAAARVFKRKGFKGTSLNDIAEELDTDRANIYYYVASKNELFEAVVSEAIESNLAGAEEIRTGPGTPHEKLRTMIEALMNSYAEHYPFLYVYIQENLSQVGEGRADWAAKMRAINKRYEDLMIGIIEEGYRDKTLRNVGPAWVVAYGILGVVGWTNRWFDPTRSKADAATIGRTYAEMVLGGLAT